MANNPGIISHVKWREAVDEVDALFEEFRAKGSRARKDRAIFIYGESNAGKSFFIDHCAKTFAARAVAPASNNIGSSSGSIQNAPSNAARPFPVIKVKTPSTPDRTQFARELYRELFGQVKIIPEEWSENRIIQEAQKQMREIGCMLLLIDEAQQLTFPQKEEERVDVITFIKGLIDNSSAPIVFAGLENLLDLQRDPQMQTRTFAIVDLAFDWNFETDRVGMMSAVAQCCADEGLPLDKKDILAVSRRLWAASKGLFGRVQWLVRSAAAVSGPAAATDTLARLSRAYRRLPRPPAAPGTFGPMARPVDRHWLPDDKDPFLCPDELLETLWPVIVDKTAAKQATAAADADKAKARHKAETV